MHYIFDNYTNASRCKCKFEQYIIVIVDIFLGTITYEMDLDIVRLSYSN